jgi:hypothetical protein
VDKPANPHARIVIVKRDDKCDTKQDDKKKQKEKCMKVSQWTEKISKADVAAGHHYEVWQALVSKAERQAREGKYGAKADVCLAKLLGGVLVDYLQKADNEMSEFTRDAAERPSNPLRKVHAEKVMEARAETIMKREGIDYSHALARVLDADPNLYTAYTEEMRESVDARVEKIAKRSRPTIDDEDTDEDDGDDDDDGNTDDEGADRLRDKRRKGVSMKARAKHDYGPNDAGLWDKDKLSKVTKALGYNIVKA